MYKVSEGVMKAMVRWKRAHCRWKRAREQDDYFRTLRGHPKGLPSGGHSGLPSALGALCGRSNGLPSLCGRSNGLPSAVEVLPPRVLCSESQLRSESKNKTKIDMSQHRMSQPVIPRESSSSSSPLPISF